jgi:CHAT domain-containing protein
LLTENDSFLGERSEIAYVGSGRDLLREFGVSDRRLLALAAPDFDEDGRQQAPRPNAALAATSGSRRYRSQQLTALPGALREATWLREKGRLARLEAVALTGAAASEENLVAAGAPRFLHLATHGLFLQLPPANRERPGVFLSNPMDRAALAFSGAAATLRAWDEGRYPPPGADGILTAREIGTLDLAGTELVVLSACDTGQGEARDGEGVLGLRRGFSRAGAKNLLLTLWPVEDGISALFMADFYSQIFSGIEPSTALATVQARWLSRLRRERNLTEAARVAGPYVLALQGVLPELPNRRP